MQGIECNSQWQCMLPDEAAGLESSMAGWRWQQHKILIAQTCSSCEEHRATTIAAIKGVAATYEGTPLTPDQGAEALCVHA